MNSITRKLVLSILTVVLTVVALGTTTFAWFTLTNTATVQPFQANITADTGIEIALGTPLAGQEDTLNWVTTLTTAAINDYITAEYGAFTFSHVTTSDGINFNTLGTSSMTPATGGYLEIPINFRSNSATSINWTGVSLTSGVQQWQADVDFVGASGTAYTSGDMVNFDAADAFRIAILGTVGGLSNIVTYERGYDVVSAPHNIILDGDGAAQDLSDGVAAGEGDAGAMNYYYAKSNVLPWGANAVTVLDTIQSIASEPVVSLTASTTAGAANYGQIMIRIWLEGWDANAYNLILGEMIIVSFEFTGA